MAQTTEPEARPPEPVPTPPGRAEPPPPAAVGPALRATRVLVLRGLGLSYLAAFASLWVQVDGLIGPAGILPADALLAALEARYGAQVHALLPTLAWWTGAGTGALHAFCALGTLAALALAAGIASGPAALVCWALYLSLVPLGQTFLSFQWDALLLEAGLLALPLCVWSRASDWRVREEPDPLALWLMRLLLFKLMFSSGWVKLASGDPTWWDGSALAYHYWTTCLPTWSGWLLAHLPLALHRIATWSAVGIELVAPLCLFAGRRARIGAAAALAALQVAIAATGNYGFFNLLSLALCASALDDAALSAAATRLRLRALLAAWQARMGRARGARRRDSRAGARAPRPRHWLALALALAWLPPSSARLAATLGLGALVPAPLAEWTQLAARFHAANGYGLFAVMTTHRPEIVIEGSQDGQRWREYGFRYKPGDPSRRPEFAGLHMPRLDWQMWFAALSSPRAQPWFAQFMRRLHEGAPAVLALLGHDPFAGAPPRWLRARLYEYRPTPLGVWRRTGAWWEREPAGLYFGPVERPPGAVSR